MKKTIVLTLAFVMCLFATSFAQQDAKMMKKDKMAHKTTMTDKEMSKKDKMMMDSDKTMKATMTEKGMAKKDKMMHGDKSMTMSKVQTIKLEQTKGKFNVEQLTLEAGNTYVFEVTNKGVDHEVGFVIAPKGKTDQANHIKEAYVAKTIKNGEMSSSKEVTLAKGEYVYFCPLNSTPQYTIIVE